MSVERDVTRTIAAATWMVCIVVFLTTPLSGLAAASTGAVSPDAGFDRDSPGTWEDIETAVPDRTVRSDTRQSLRLTKAENGSVSTPGNSTITDSETGNGNEVTIEVTYDEVMAQNTTAVTVSPDVNGDLTTTPVVENKRWSDARTFRADLQFTDDNESVSGVGLEVAGAKDEEHSVQSAVSMTYDVDTDEPVIESAEVTAPFAVTVTFSEGVYSNENGTGALSTADFVYRDVSQSGASGIHSVSHTEGEAKAVLALENQIQNSDLGTDRIDVSPRTIFDAAGNSLSADSYTYSDAVSDDVKPTVETITATESGPGIAVSFTVDERISSATITIDNSTTIRDDDLNETLTSGGMYTYTAHHTPGSDGTYRVAFDSISDGRNTVTFFGTKTPADVTVDTTGPTIGRLTAPEAFTNTTTPTIRVVGVSDRLSSVNERSVTVEIEERNGSTVRTFADPSTTRLSYTNKTVTLDLSMTEWSLRNGKTYDVTVTAADTDEPSNSNSKAFTSAFTVNTDAPTVDTLSLSSNPIGDAQTGDGNEVTLTVTFSEEMNENPEDVTISPDLNGDLSTQPAVENKRWSDARTFRADIQFTDDNESVSDVNLKVDGAKDLAGNSMQRGVSMTYDVETGVGIHEDMKIMVVLSVGLLIYYRVLRSGQQY